MAKQVIIPLPDKDFDTTEVSIPWKHFVEAGLHVTFSPEAGKMGQTDPRLLTGVIFGQLGAKPDALAAYRELEKDEAFYYLTSWRLGDYYRTYPEYVEDETVKALKEKGDFIFERMENSWQSFSDPILSACRCAISPPRARFTQRCWACLSIRASTLPILFSSIPARSLLHSAKQK